MSKTVAPWSHAFVRQLEMLQNRGDCHPYTCGTEECRAILVPTVRGWICQYCDYTQDWAGHVEVTDEQLESMADTYMEALSGLPEVAIRTELGFLQANIPAVYDIVVKRLKQLEEGEQDGTDERHN